MTSSATAEGVWFFGGKGGVGKTTCACAFTLQLPPPVLLLSLDPAHSVRDVLGDDSGLTILELDARAEFSEWMRRHREDLRVVADRGTYFDDEDIQGFLDLSLPGLDELMGLLKLGELVREQPDRRIVVDLPPTGHALRLFDVSEALDQFVDALELMQDKHRFAVSSLTRRYSPDAIDAFLEDLRESCAVAKRALMAPGVCNFALVTRPEPMVLAETARYAERLRGVGLEPAALVVNMAVAPVELPAELDPLRTIYLPVFERPPVGRAALEPITEALSQLVDEGKRPRSPHLTSVRLRRTVGEEYGFGTIAPLLADPRRLMVFGGKGGVGKTTMAAATAVGLARRDRRRSVVVVSIDPAHSLGDSLGQRLGDEAQVVDGIANLRAAELDPARHWARFKEDWAAEGQELFGGLPGAGRLDPVYDRQIAEQLGQIQPTGLDELQAALYVIDLMDEDADRVVIVDAAPTGHLLRFLETPRLVIDWAKELMHLLLKYGLATKVKRISEDLLELSRKSKRLDALLHDPQLCEIVVVTMAEPPVLAETERLIAKLAEMSVPVRRVVVNQAHGPAEEVRRRHPKLDVLEIGRRNAPLQGLQALEDLAA